MSGYKFKIGARVRHISRDDRIISHGAIGTVLEEHLCPYVQWDGFTRGHNGGNPTVPDSSWAVREDALELIECGTKNTTSVRAALIAARNAIDDALNLLG